MATSPRPVILPQWQGFAFSSLAPMMAVVFTNPFDVAKVRIQLQGELARKGTPKVYTNSLDCLVKVFKHEGALGLEKGLSTAALREGSKNLFRLGLYNPMLSLMHNKDDGPAALWQRMLAGAVSGAAGAVACNPFEIVKTRMQATASKAIATGHQHSYTNVFDAFRGIVAREGLRGLYKGTSASVLRSAIGTGVNLTAYTYLRENILERGWMKDSSLLDVACSFISSFFTAIFINPVDVVRTRLYNQPSGPDGKGLLYDGALDAAKKIISTEGYGAFFKGFSSSFLRLGPHFVLTFVFLEQLRRFSLASIREKLELAHLKTVFAFYDTDRDGNIGVQELEHAYRQAYPRNQQSLSRDQYEALLSSNIKGIMERGDVDHSGTLDFIEFRAVSSDLIKLMRRHEQQVAFESLDLDRDGQLSKLEIKKALKAIAPARIQDPHMTEAQYETELQKDIDRMFDKADGNNDGKVSFDEFSRMVTGVENLQIGRALDAWMRNAGVAHS